MIPTSARREAAFTRQPAPPAEPAPPTMRRSLEQLAHCVEEARSVLAGVEGGRDAEDLRHAVADLEQAEQLLSLVLRNMRRAVLAR